MTTIETLLRLTGATRDQLEIIAKQRNIPIPDGEPSHRKPFRQGGRWESKR